MLQHTKPNDVVSVQAEKYGPPNPYSSGYGVKIPTRYLIKMKDGRKRRVFCNCFSNIGSLWITVNKGRQYLLEKTRNNSMKGE